MWPAPDGLQHLQAQQKYLLIDQHHCSSAGKHGNVVAILFRLMRSRTDAEMRAALALFVERMKAPDMQAARDSLTRWLGMTLQEEFSETSISLEEEPTMLFDKKFKRYEDLLEYEAVEKGRAKGSEEGLQEGLRIALGDLLQDDVLSVDVYEKISTADSEQLQAWIKSLVKGVAPQQLFAGG